MNYFKSEKISAHITKIINPAMVYSYLVEGNDSAVLIDTGAGLGDLKAFVEGLTSKPYVVLLTHGHVDHAGGASLFGQVYLNERDWSLAAEHTQIPARLGFIKGSEKGKIHEEDMVPPMETGYLPLTDGQEFDLGGLTVVAYDLVGHTESSMAILMKEERTMLLGDACNSFTFLQMPTSPVLSVYADTVEAFVAKHFDEIDTVLFSHGHNTGTPEILKEAVELCRDIASGKVKGVPAHGGMMEGCLFGAPISLLGKRKDGKTFNCVYPEKSAR